MPTTARARRGGAAAAARVTMVVALCCAMLAVAGLAGVVRAEEPRVDVNWKCRVCEDAVQTWHDQFPCAGGFLDWGDTLSPNINGCMGPQFKCNSLGGKLRDACLSMEEELSVTNGLLSKTLWESMMMHDDPYRACIELKKCPAEPNIEDKATWSPCLQAFRNTSTGHRPYSRQYAEVCEEPCYLCMFLVKYWPLFGEVCRPEGASLPQSVPLPNDVKPATLLETAAAARGRPYLDRLSRQAALAPPTPIRGPGAQERFADVSQEAAAVSRARARAAAYERMAAMATESAHASPEGDKTELQTGLTLPKECFARWKEIERTPRVRYFVSWKKYVNVLANNLDRLEGRMWDANTVCKCLGHCDVSRFEDLGLVGACQYGDIEEQMMDYLFREEGKIPQFTEV